MASDRSFCSVKPDERERERFRERTCLATKVLQRRYKDRRQDLLLKARKCNALVERKKPRIQWLLDSNRETKRCCTSCPDEVEKQRERERERSTEAKEKEAQNKRHRSKGCVSFKKIASSLSFPSFVLTFPSLWFFLCDNSSLLLWHDIAIIFSVFENRVSYFPLLHFWSQREEEIGMEIKYVSLSVASKSPLWFFLYPFLIRCFLTNDSFALISSRSSLFLIFSLTKQSAVEEEEQSLRSSWGWIDECLVSPFLSCLSLSFSLLHLLLSLRLSFASRDFSWVFPPDFCSSSFDGRVLLSCHSSLYSSPEYFSDSPKRIRRGGVETDQEEGGEEQGIESHEETRKFWSKRERERNVSANGFPLVFRWRWLFLSWLRAK